MDCAIVSNFRRQRRGLGTARPKLIMRMMRDHLGILFAFFATGPGLGLIMYIFTTLEFPTHNSDFHLFTASVDAKYYY